MTDAIRVENVDTIRGAKLVANRDYCVNEVIASFDSAPVADRQTYQTVQVGPALHVRVGSKLSNLNHSCMPNVIIYTDKRQLLACANVRSGEELTYFYPSTEWEMTEHFQCQCGHESCLDLVNGAKHLTLKTLSGYFINSHIRNLAMQCLSSLTFPK